MKKLLLIFVLLLLPSAALAQCNGAFPANNACGTIVGGPPGPVPFSSIAGLCITSGSFLVGNGTTTQCSTISGSQAVVQFLYGGSAAGSSLTLGSTSNGSPSGDSINLNQGGNTLLGIAGSRIIVTGPSGINSVLKVVSNDAGGSEQPLTILNGSMATTNSIEFLVGRDLTQYDNTAFAFEWIGDTNVNNYGWVGTSFNDRTLKWDSQGFVGVQRSTNNLSHCFEVGTATTAPFSVDCSGNIVGNVSFADLPAGTSNTVLGYWGSTVVSAIGVNNCTGALTYSTSSNTFGCNTGSGSGSVTSVGSGYGLTGGPITTSGTLAVNLTTASNVLAADVNLSTTSTYFDGPSMAQGATGTWFASGTVSLNDTGTTAAFYCKLWDGTTVISSSVTQLYAASVTTTMTLSGQITSPAGNIRISCRDTNSTAGKIKFNVTGNSADSSIFGHRIQ